MGTDIDIGVVVISVIIVQPQPGEILKSRQYSLLSQQ